MADTLSPQVLRLLDRNNTWTGVQNFVGGGTGTGNVSTPGTLTAHALAVGGGAQSVSPLASLGTATQVLHGNAAGDPTFSAVDLTADVTGVLAGSKGGGLVQLAQVITTGSQTTVDFPTISGVYNALRLVYFSRDTAGGTSFSVIRVRINNDSTSGNYTASQRNGAQGGAAFASTAAATSGGMWIGTHPNDGNTAGIVASGEICLPGYANATFQKQLFATCAEFDGTNGGLISLAQAMWKSASPITRVTVTTDGTAFKDGVIWTLYGMN